MTTRQCWIDINFLSQWTKPRRVIFITHFLHIIKDTRRHGQELLYKICKAYSMMKTFIKNSFFLLLYHCSICQRNSILCFGENQEWLWDFYKNSFEDHHCKFCQLERLSRAVTGPAQSLFWSEPGSSYVWTPVASDSFYCQVPTLHGLLYHWLTTLWRIEHNLSCSLGSPKDLKERFSVSWIWRYLEGNGNPLQCSCLENPRDGGAWWAAVYGVTQSRTRLKWLSLA